MPKTPGWTISDAQLGRALRRYLAEVQDCEVLKLPGDRTEAYVLAAHDPERPAGDVAQVAVRLAAPTLDGLIEMLLGEAEDLGRDLAIDQLFDDEDAGFNMNGLSLGTLVAALRFAPGVPIPRELLYAVNASVQPPARDNRDPDAGPDLDDGARYFSHPALILADETIEHLRRAGVFIRHPDDTVILHEDLQTTPDRVAPQIGVALAEQALLELVPQLFNAKNDALLRRVQPHLRHVTDQLLPLATPNAMALAFLVADYYTTVDPDLDHLRHYTTQGCAILDLVIDQLEPRMISWLAHDLYGLAKVAQDAGMDDIAQIAYVRSFELRWRPPSDTDEDDDDLVALLSGSPTDTAAMDWMIAELAVTTSLACGDMSAARRIADRVHARAETEIDLIGVRQADYLMASTSTCTGRRSRRWNASTGSSVGARMSQMIPTTCSWSSTCCSWRSLSWPGWSCAQALLTARNACSTGRLGRSTATRCKIFLLMT